MTRSTTTTTPSPRELSAAEMREAAGGGTAVFGLHKSTNVALKRG